ncbi:hypothetical protein [Sphingomonas sp. VDB2]|uniref:hypothetical protein n=1 Tax=Sphingomonas sp. VDB2 TaxID=3228751 RepID=UPI003A7FB81A
MITETLIDDDVWADAPENNQEAFLFVATRGRQKLDSIIAAKAIGDALIGQPYGEDEWRDQYIHEISTLADSLGISGLHGLSQSIGSAINRQNFMASLARVLTRIKAERRAELRADSVRLSYQTKKTIRENLEELRAKVNASNLSDEVKAALHKKIDAVEAELDHQRSSLRPIWLLHGAIALFSVMPPAVGMLNDAPGAIATMKAISHSVHQAKADEESLERAKHHPPLLTDDRPKQIEDHSGNT